MKQFLYIISLFLISFLSSAQDSKQEKLEQQKAQIQKEIAAYKSLFNEEKKKEKSALGQLSQQKVRIQLSQKLINTTEKQKALLEDNIYLKQLEINKLSKELSILKEDYAKMIVKSYKSRSEKSRIMFVLSSQSFLQAYKRIQYMKQYASFRKMQGDEIMTKQQQLGVAKTQLETSKKDKEKVIAEGEAEKKELESEKKKQEGLIKELQKNKKKYMAEIDKKQKEARAVDAQIKKLIAEAIAEANRKKAAAAAAAGNTTAASSATSSSKFVLTAEDKIVSNNFKSNKGKLPWPVEKGYLQQGFGNYADPVYKGVTHINNGVEIAAESGSYARAVFDGEVLRVQLLKGTNRKTVYIQHGDFISIYHNLDNVSVKEGQKVTIKQSIGRIHTDDSGKAVLKFYINQNTTTLNPQQWIYNM